jgi:HSP20 family protein
MALTRWAPFQGLLDVQRDMDLLMRRLWGTGELSNGHTGSQARAWVPAVDLFHRDGDLVVRAELPGIDPEQDVEISFHEGMLTIRGERRHQERADEGNVARFESRFGSFERTVALPGGVTEDAISATYENGILEVVVQGVAELTGAKKIPVRAGSTRTSITTNAQTTS